MTDVASIYERFGDTAPTPIAESLFSVHSEDGTLVAQDVSNSVAQRIRREYKNIFGGTYNIIETHTTLKGGKTIFSGTSEKFFHSPAHVPSHVSMFDVQIDSHVVAKNMTAEATRDFIVASVDVLDIFSAIAEFLVGDNDTIGSTLDTRIAAISSLTFNRVRGITTIKYSPVENNAPTPEPIKNDWRGIKKSRPMAAMRVREYNSIRVPQEVLETKGFNIVDVANLSVIYSGTKETCLNYIEQMRAQRIPLYAIRVIEYKDFDNYLSRVSENGVVATHNGKVVVIGTEGEVKHFVINGIKRGHLVKRAVRVFDIFEPTESEEE